MELKLLKFSTSWCGPCKLQKEEFKNNPPSIDLQEIDVDSGDPKVIELMSKYRIMSVPTMIIVNSEGESQIRFTGYISSSKIEEAINNIQNTKEVTDETDKTII